MMKQLLIASAAVAMLGVAACQKTEEKAAEAPAADAAAAPAAAPAADAAAAPAEKH